jgi:hypothetical protein
VAVPAKICLQSCQLIIPYFKNTQVWMLGEPEGFQFPPGFCRNRTVNHIPAASSRL